MGREGIIAARPCADDHGRMRRSESKVGQVANLAALAGSTFFVVALLATALAPSERAVAVAMGGLLVVLLAAVLAAARRLRLRRQLLAAGENEERERTSGDYSSNKR